MESHTNPLDQAKQDSQGTSYHDHVEHFDLLYKITPYAEKESSLIHYHECYEVVFYISANVEAYLDEQHYTLNFHDILLIPPLKMHKLIYSECQNYIRYVFYFTQEHIEKAFSPLSLKKALAFFRNPGCNKLSLSAPEYLRMNGIFRNMYEHKLSASHKNRDLLSTYASVILQELYLSFESQSPQKQEPAELTPVEQILKYINENYSKSITLEDLEEHFYLNKSYICRIFRKTMGISVINYLHYKRVLAAQQLLLNTELPIIDIALECGFNNVQHFYRIFKKITQLTPNEYKKHQLSTRLGQTFSLVSKENLFS